MKSPTLPAILKVAEAQPSYLPPYCLTCRKPLHRGNGEARRKRHPVCAKAWQSVYQAEWRRLHPERVGRRAGKLGY